MKEASRVLHRYQRKLDVDMLCFDINKIHVLQ